MALLKKADAIVAAVLVGLGAAPVSSAFLCAESSCRSARDAVLFYGVGLVAAVIAAPLFWRTRRWWHRVLVLAGALASSSVLPAWVLRHGRWLVPLPSAVSCVVRAGARADDVHRWCGRPTYWCNGPKHVDSGGPLNPFSVVVCGFSGDVYGARLVTYDCGGRVESVIGFEGGTPERSRPAHCVTWGQ